MTHLAPYGWLNIYSKGEDDEGQCFFEMSIVLTINLLGCLLCVDLQVCKF